MQKRLYNISNSWLDFLQTLKGTNLYADFIQELHNHTLIGEYVTTDNLIKYKQNNLYFHSITENGSNLICFDIERTYKLFEKYGLLITPIEKIEENITDFETFTSTINNFAEMIQSTSMMIQEEGSVRKITLY